MFKFKKKSSTASEQADTTEASWLSRLSNGLRRTRENLANGLSSIFLGKQQIDDDLFEALEAQLLTADVGVETTEYILESLTNSVKRQQLADPSALSEQLKTILLDILTPVSTPLNPDIAHPFVLLMVGVNGAGKTTSIAKIAHHYKQAGKNVMLAAGDTFRAAAIEQLQTWGERNQVPVIAQQSGSDSAAVIFDAVQSAQSKQCDLLIADTAGRLHTQDNLMSELEKIKRVIKKVEPNAPHETMLVVDASMGQNALEQAKQFHEAIGLDSITLTKLDGTAKGGIVFAIANELKLPYRFIGVGEKRDDLKPFDANEFVNALFE